MDSINIFGMNGIQINFWTMIAQWFAAIGTIGAVIVALWLSFREKRIILKVWAEKAFLVGGEKTEAVVNITVVNLGMKDAIIEGFTWKMPFQKEMFYQIFNDITLPNEQLPCLIKEGQKKTFLIRYEQFERNISEIILNNPNISVGKLKNFKIEVSTSVNKTFSRKIGKGLCKSIAEIYAKIQKVSDENDNKTKD